MNPMRNRQIHWRVYKSGSLFDTGFALNETATFALKLCDGSNTIQKIASEMAEHYKISYSEAESDLKELLEVLTENDLIKWVDSPT